MDIFTYDVLIWTATSAGLTKSQTTLDWDLRPSRLHTSSDDRTSHCLLILLPTGRTTLCANIYGCNLDKQTTQPVGWKSLFRDMHPDNLSIFCQIPKLMYPWWSPDSKSHGTNMGPVWVLSAPDGPHVGPMNFVIWVHIRTNFISISISSYLSIVPLRACMIFGFYNQNVYIYIYMCT